MKDFIYYSHFNIFIIFILRMNFIYLIYKDIPIFLVIHALMINFVTANFLCAFIAILIVTSYIMII